MSKLYLVQLLHEKDKKHLYPKWEIVEFIDLVNAVNAYFADRGFQRSILIGDYTPQVNPIEVPRINIPRYGNDKTYELFLTALGFKGYRHELYPVQILSSSHTDDVHVHLIVSPWREYYGGARGYNYGKLSVSTGATYSDLKSVYASFLQRVSDKIARERLLRRAWRMYVSSPLSHELSHAIIEDSGLEREQEPSITKIDPYTWNNKLYYFYDPNSFLRK